MTIAELQKLLSTFEDSSLEVGTFRTYYSSNSMGYGSKHHIFESFTGNFSINGKEHRLNLK